MQGNPYKLSKNDNHLFYFRAPPKKHNKKFQRTAFGSR